MRRWTADGPRLWGKVQDMRGCVADGGRCPTPFEERAKWRDSPPPPAPSAQDNGQTRMSRLDKAVPTHPPGPDIPLLSGTGTGPRHDTAPCPVPLSNTRPRHTRNSVGNSCTRHATHSDGASWGGASGGARQWQVGPQDPGRRGGFPRRPCDAPQAPETRRKAGTSPQTPH